MLLAWLKKRRRRRLLATPFPESFDKCLTENVWQVRHLPTADRETLIRSLQVFIAEKHWEPCRGFEITDEVKITISGQACLLLLGLDADAFQRVKSVLVYPGGFRAPFREYLDSGEVIEGEDDLLGQTQYGGPVAIAWDEVLAAGRGQSDGVNPVLHEFAHQLDYLNGSLDGTPLLPSQTAYARWKEVMTEEFSLLRHAVGRGKETLIDPYGATDEAEFFAVVTECFFEMPLELLHGHSELYGIFRDYYGRHPAAWFAGTTR
jgi:Mlc titration factor MtfA (ptsG expression regulator)